MDEKNLDELKKETMIDNSALEEIMKEEITPEMQMKLIETLKQSQLYLPVIFSANMFEGIENAKEGDIFETTGKEGFDINYLNMSDGQKAVPLFTSDEAMKKAGLQSSSAMVMFASDIADMLKESDRYSVVAINPNTDNDINMPFHVFIAMFEEPTEEENEMFEALGHILKILKEKSVALEEDYAFFVRDSEPFMKQQAVDGVFIPNVPFNISSRKDFKEELEYLNILLLPKTTRIVYIGGIVDENSWDTIIAPGSEFHHVEDVDEFTSVWKCGAQPFYDD